ncbi:integrator complex subunit 3 homolog isoform X1 [Drosophila tropicalis]|uniref:integrator complex subunit 3 homolog isoform X1 n=1 Tax=Drosophila tropicalis TaxID=46794 RepID=UPI0035ABD76F
MGISVALVIKPVNCHSTNQSSSRLVDDSELSASERSRRLIPYMAFYLPAPELPINQQYVAKHSSAAGSALLQAPAPGGRIPVPLAYMPPQHQHQHPPHSHPHPPPHHLPHSQRAHYQSEAGDVYHALAIGGSHHTPSPSPVQGKDQQPIPPDVGATFIAYKPLNPTHKHKTVQHFPPLTPQEQQHHHHHQQPHPPQQQQQFELLSPPFHRQRAKQSKINLTPFTPQNTLPGQFIPIIYTPLSNSNNNDPPPPPPPHNGGNTINYNNHNSNKSPPLPPPTEIVFQTSPHKNSHQTQIVTDYASASAEVTSSAEQQSSEEQEEPQHQPQQQHQQPVVPEQPSPSSPAPPQFVDYLIDGPTQSLEEDQHHQQQQQKPQHAYILVTTTAPRIEQHPSKPQLHEISTQHPPPTAYNRQPTLRLKPVQHTYKATRRPIYVTTTTQAPPPTPPHAPSSHTVEITPKYVYVSSKPPLNSNEEEFVPSRESSTVAPIRLKPIYKYAHERPPILTPHSHQQSEEDQLPDIRTSSLAEILHKLQASNHLPHTLTPDNIDNSIKTLIRILQNLKQTQTIVPNPPQHHETQSNKHKDYDYENSSENQGGIITTSNEEQDNDEALTKFKGPNKHPGPSTGRPGIDYPNYAEIPQTSFECTKQRYKGFFGDPETNCQVWHYCDLNGGKASFLCPNGTIFSQIALTCDWWFNVKCSTTPQLYVLNERLYKYILPFNPKFPEDYNGPIVDKYLAMKFQEMEEKMRLEKQRKASKQQSEKSGDEAASTTSALPKNHKPSPSTHGSGINAQVYEQSSEKNLLIDDEIDDISERGTFDTYGQSAPTTVMAPTSSTLETQSFGLKPIVVSSTTRPDIQFEIEPTSPEISSTSEEEDKLQSLRDTKAAENNNSKLETTKVSVEKLEVIEIKTDGNTGQLMPITTSSE